MLYFLLTTFLTRLFPPKLVTHSRACLKIHSRHQHAPLCGIFAPNSGYVARYAPFIRGQISHKL
ncbi:DUF6783 domain-containing protein [Robinsoniella sp. KNHs210]|uniref:DUF6783 domain-containing protein n=1 Tax=Robinsoniella sp. KNHs210 TaxID=1469950 RepID=UPI002FE5C52D